MIPPTMWRSELFHPLFAHFPIALLTFATAFYLIFLVRRRPGVHTAFLLNLFAGVGCAWGSIWLGTIAEDVVNRVICDPTMTHEHEDFAYYATWAFSAALVLVFLQFYVAKLKGRAIEIFIILSLITGTGFLGYAGHLGATLVYQLGAAVYHPSPECTEFE